MVEMTPDHLEAQVNLELQEADANDEDDVTEFSVRLIEKLAKDNKAKPGEGVDSCAAEGPSLPVDPLSLSSLLSQGFEEGPARQALRKHQNNTQAALDWLIRGASEDTEKLPADGVRMPVTVKRIQRLKARMKAKHRDRRRNNTVTEASQDEKEKEKEREQREVDQRQEDAKAKLKVKAKVQADLLDIMSDDPPAPTDFSKEVELMSLPPQLGFNLAMCEKPPLPASLAAGTAQPRSPYGSLSMQGSAAAAQLAQILAQSNGITPQQLLAAAQQMQLQTAQGQQAAQQMQLQAALGQQAAPPDPLELNVFDPF